MAKTVNSIAALQKEMQRRINIALEGEAKQVVEDTMKKHVQDDVLGAYEPVMYERRGSGGIDDETNIKSTVRDHVLTVKDVAPLEGPRVPGYIASRASQTEFAKLLEGYGKGIADPWGSRYTNWRKPRPFVTNAKEEVARSNSRANAKIKKAIKKQFPE